MKKIFYILILLFTSATFAQQDESFCLASTNSSHLIDLETIRGLDHSNDIFNLKIYLHVLRKETEPKLGQSIEDVNRQLKYLYDDFDPLGIHFVWDGGIDYIDNDAFFNDPDYYSNPIDFPNGTEPIFNTNNHSDGIDIYFFDAEKGIGGSSIGGGFGRADDVGGSALIVGGLFKGHHNGDEMIPLSWTKVISHEMGHILFLFHTFHGTSPLEQDGSTCSEIVNPVTDPNDPLYFEQVTNGSQCGDYIVDTPADPGISWFSDVYSEVDENCQYEPILYPNDAIPDYDENGDTYNPDPTNLMCYTYPTCYDSFTLGQKKRMKNAIWYLSVLNNQLTSDYTYIRALSSENCYVCDFSFYEIYSSVDIAQLSVSSSSNVTTQITNTSNNSFTLKVSNNLDQNANEGERGSFSIVKSGLGIIVAIQPIWVGMPQSVPDETVNGALEVSSGQLVHHKIDDGNLRLEGIETYDWNFPEPNESWVLFGGPPANNSSVWEYRYFSKYVPKAINSSAGNDTGIVTVRGENPCGLGDNGGEENELCVKNLDDFDGEPDCSTPPAPIYYYPNPAGSLLEIDLSLQEYKIFNIIIYDEYQTVRYSDQSENVVKTVDTFNLTNGTYYLHIYDGSDLILSAILIINH